ncbi:hypothetical protein J6590_062470 [Homalodisca vitripennis]|nr:hypothetical protein J6590_062470 [Homalodisca vitripennis]
MPAEQITKVDWPSRTSAHETPGELDLGQVNHKGTEQGRAKMGTSWVAPEVEDKADLCTTASLIFMSDEGCTRLQRPRGIVWSTLSNALEMSRSVNGTWTYYSDKHMFLESNQIG